MLNKHVKNLFNLIANQSLTLYQTSKIATISFNL